MVKCVSFTGDDGAVAVRDDEIYHAASPLLLRPSSYILEFPKVAAEKFESDRDLVESFFPVTHQILNFYFPLVQEGAMWALICHASD